MKGKKIIFSGKGIKWQLISYSSSSLVHFSSPVIPSLANVALISLVGVSGRGIARKGGKKMKTLWYRPVVLKMWSGTSSHRITQKLVRSKHSWVQLCFNKPSQVILMTDNDSG